MCLWVQLLERERRRQQSIKCLNPGVMFSCVRLHVYIIRVHVTDRSSVQACVCALVVVRARMCVCLRVRLSMSACVRACVHE